MTNTQQEKTLQSFSLIKSVVLLFAVYANIQYAVFFLNPAHIGNIPFYALNLMADLISVPLFIFTWLSCFHYEIRKNSYFKKIKTTQHYADNIIFPTTGIIVTTASESIDIIKATLAAILSLDGKKHVYVLDDGKRDELKVLCRKWNIMYITRPNKKFFKSGNLNNGLKHVTEQFIAIFDADFLPKKDFLIKTLPFFEDEKVGVVQTPQVYYNDENFISRGGRNLQTIFYDSILPSKSLMNSAFSVGTNAVFRKDALDKIHGFDFIEEGEDISTSLTLAENGYKVFYLNEQLAYGLTPSNIISFFNQQFRWARSGINMFFKRNSLGNTKLSIIQKLQYFMSSFFYFSGIAIFLYLINPFIAIVFNVKPINEFYFNEWIMSYGLFIGANLLLSFSMLKRNRIETMSLGIFCFIPYLAVVFSSLFKIKFHWKPTNKASRQLVTKLISPLVVYLVSSFSIFFYTLITTSFLYSPYSLWLLINSFFAFYLIIGSYHSIGYENKISLDKIPYELIFQKNKSNNKSTQREEIPYEKTWLNKV